MTPTLDFVVTAPPARRVPGQALEQAMGALPMPVPAPRPSQASSYDAGDLTCERILTWLRGEQ